MSPGYTRIKNYQIWHQLSFSEVSFNPEICKSLRSIYATSQEEPI